MTNMYIIQTSIVLSHTASLRSLIDRIVTYGFASLARDPSLTLQIGALTCLFHLLDGFSHSEHSYAPYIYKTLIFALIENHANEVAREFIISNIIFTLEECRLPVGVMVPPIVKQASLYGYNNHDFDFFITLAKHPRLTLRHGLLLVDLLGKYA